MYDITIHLNAESKIPLYEQIYAYIKKEIQTGRIPFHEKLPSTRLLSAHLQVSRSTVDLAYEQLLSEGYIEAVPYVGYFVCQIEELYQLERLAVSARQETDNKPEQYEVDFSPNGIDLGSFPYNTWRRLSKEVLSDEHGDIFKLGDSKGEADLRLTISNYLHQARGVNCSPSQVVVGAGNDYLLMLLGMVLGDSHRIAMENPSYKQAYRVFRNLGYQVRAVEMDKSGMKVDELERSKANIAYVMPSHQYPLGIVMPIKRRMELLRWANEEDNRYLIEDDYDSEFRYKGKPIPALQGYDMNEKVIYIGTFSKSIAPAIRISYLVLPRQLLYIYERKCKFLSNTVSRVDQMILSSFLRDGYYGRHLNKMRSIYKGKHDLLVNQLKKMGDICEIQGEQAGVHILVKFNNGMTEKEAISLAKKERIKLYGLSRYYIKPVKNQSMVIMGYANLSEADIINAVNKLIKVFSSF